ncbi:hypothetical protein [Candidatus Nitrososphaera sp. FF02]
MQAMLARPVGSYTAAGISAPACSTVNMTWPPSIACGFVFTIQRINPAV